MKIQAKLLQQRLDIVTSILGRASVSMVTGCVTLNADPAGLRLSCNDGNMFVSTVVPCDHAGELTALVPGKRLQAVAKAYEGELEITQQAGHKIKISAGGSSAILCGIDPREAIAGPPPVLDEVTLDAPLKTMLEAVRPAMSQDTTRAAICGIRVEITDHKLHLVASDGRRMAVAEAEQHAPDMAGTIPDQALKGLLLLLDNASRVDLAMNANRIEVTTDAGWISAPLVEAAYPRWRQVLPVFEPYPVTLNRVDLLASLRRVAMMTDDTYAINLTLAKDQLSLGAQTVNTGEAGDTLDCLVTNPLTIRLNWRFLADALQTGGEVVELQYGASTDPLTVLHKEPVKNSDATVRHIIMPMRAQ